MNTRIEFAQELRNEQRKNQMTGAWETIRFYKLSQPISYRGADRKTHATYYVNERATEQGVRVFPADRFGEERRSNALANRVEELAQHVTHLNLVNFNSK